MTRPPIAFGGLPALLAKHTMATQCGLDPCVPTTDTAAERDSHTARFKLRAVRAALARPVWYRISPTCREFGVSSPELRGWIKDRDELESLCVLEACVDAVALESRSPDSPRFVTWPHNSRTARGRSLSRRLPPLRPGLPCVRMSPRRVWRSYRRGRRFSGSIRSKNCRKRTRGQRAGWRGRAIRAQARKGLGCPRSVR